MGANGQIGFSTGLYAGPGGERNFVDLVLADSGQPLGGRSTSGEDAGYYTESRYNALGQLIATNEGSSVWRHFGVDANGNRVATYTTGVSGENLATAAEVRDSYAEFDGRNRLVAEYGVATEVYGAPAPPRPWWTPSPARTAVPPLWTTTTATA